MADPCSVALVKPVSSAVLLHQDVLGSGISWLRRIDELQPLLMVQAESLTPAGCQQGPG